MIILIFVLGAVSSVLAHDSAHSVPGITLPPGDANTFLFIALFGACPGSEEEISYFRRMNKSASCAVDGHNACLLNAYSQL